MPDIVDQLCPLQIDPKTGEPYLRLQTPHENIIITPLRPGDADPVVSILNDPSVAPWLALSENPLTKEECNEWLLRTSRPCEDVLRSLQDAQGQPELQVVGGCPVRCLRETKSDGSDVYVGDISIRRCTWAGVVDIAEKTRLVRDNEQRITGDENIVWQMADFLAPSHHRRGIMTAALNTLIHEWARPRMNVHHIRVAVYEGNEGSLAVFRKVGFQIVETIRDKVEAGGTASFRPMIILEWNLERNA